MTAQRSFGDEHHPIRVGVAQMDGHRRRRCVCGEHGDAEQEICASDAQPGRRQTVGCGGGGHDVAHYATGYSAGMSRIGPVTTTSPDSSAGPATAPAGRRIR